jgi:hypothetical protein
VPHYGPGMDETRILALRALRELLDNDGPDDWDELIACYRAMRKAIAKNKRMKRKDRARVAEHLRRLGWTEFAIDAATTHTGARAVTGYAALSDETNDSRTRRTARAPSCPGGRCQNRDILLSASRADCYCPMFGLAARTASNALTRPAPKSRLRRSATTWNAATLSSSRRWRKFLQRARLG